MYKNRVYPARSRYITHIQAYTFRGSLCYNTYTGAFTDTMYGPRAVLGTPRKCWIGTEKKRKKKRKKKKQAVPRTRAIDGNNREAVSHCMLH